MGGEGLQLPEEGVGFSSPKLTWLDGHGACCACRTLTTQGVGGVPSTLLLEAHLGVDLAPLAPPSGPALHLILLILLLPTLLPTLTDRLTVLGLVEA